MVFQDLMGLLKCERMSADCRCLSARVEPIDLELGELAEFKMQRLSDNRQVHGVLLFKESECVAWCGVEPAPSLVGHDVYDALLTHKLDFQMMDTDWALHCFFVKPELRGKGLLEKLVQSAGQYAVDRGAKRLLGFALATDKYLASTKGLRFSGSSSLFLSAGFSEIGALTESYSLYVKNVLSDNRRFKVV
jgi:GNAT superfamily N-acetyltransferase